MKRVAFAGGLGLLILAQGMPSAYAIPTLQFTSGATTVMIQDGGVGDSNPGEGSVTYIGSIGGWDLNVTTGLSKPALGTVLAPYMDLNSVSLSTEEPSDPLSIYWSDTDFGPITNTAFKSLIGGTSATTVEFRTYLNSSNSLFGTDTLLSSLGPFAPGAFSGTATSSVQTATSYSLTELVTIAAGNPEFSLTSFDAELRAVSEPSTLFFLGAGLAMLGLSLRRRLPS